MPRLFALVAFLAMTTAAQAAPPAERIPCPERYKGFIGTWTGPFQAYDQKLKGFRPYDNTVVYTEEDCYRDPASGDTYIIGRRTDVYPAFKGQPAKTEQGQLITGLRGGQADKPFLRTIDGDGTVDYTLVYRNEASELAIWKHEEPARGNSPAMTFTAIDGRDPLEEKAHKRLVTITLTVGPDARPYWQGVVTKGTHTLR
jgi:hypothetical protein